MLIIRQFCHIHIMHRMILHFLHRTLFFLIGISILNRCKDE